MKKASPCLAGLAALVLALGVTAAPAEPVPAPAQPEKPPPRDPKSPYAHSAIAAVIDANGGKPPANGTELVQALTKVGEFLQLPVPFSAVALHSGLTHPRIVMTMRPSSHQAMRGVFVPDKNSQGSRPSIGGWGGGGPSGTTKMVQPPPEPLNQLATNVTQVEGRLFLAANMEPDGRGDARVKTIEFISWNSRKLKFDFGVIEGLGTDTPELKVLDGVRCITCHKNKGPILGVAPWSNTTHTPLVRTTATEHLSNPFLKGSSPDGLSLVDSHATEVDAAVRLGGDLLRDRAIFKQLANTADGKQALALMFGAITARGSIEQNDKEIKATLNAIPLAAFLREAHTTRSAALPSTLRDFSPCGPVTHAVGSRMPDGTAMNQVAKYNLARAAGNARLPSDHQPSNPTAFAIPAVKPALHPSDILSAALLARTIGLTEKDREFLADALDEAVKRIHKHELFFGAYDESGKRIKPPVVTSATVMKQVYTGPEFADVFKDGVLPDRDDFKDRFVAGVVAVMGNRTRGGFWAARDTYASAPKFDPKAQKEKEAEALPSHACLRCHDVRGVGKAPAFSPIPLLAFDPFDVTARETWLKTANHKQKQDILARLTKRLATDKDMPPMDSLEKEMYRTKDPTALNAVKEWLEAEFKKVK